MNTKEALNSHDSEEFANAPDSQSVGSTLKRLREAKGYTLADASMRLKFSQRQISALENEEWNHLPSGMPLRGFVRNYARYLDADPDAVVTMLDQQIGEVSTALVPSNRSTALVAADLNAPEESSGWPWGWLLIILVFLLVAIFYALDSGWIPDSWLVFEWLKELKS